MRVPEYARSYFAEMFNGLYSNRSYECAHKICSS